ncbi:MAG: protease, partial [Planctomycetaceae bacterium]|nr:protease [Planctomycetaceae bacterium]
MPPYYTSPFAHLPLLMRFHGAAKIQGGGKDSAQTKINKLNAARHSGMLVVKAKSATNNWQVNQAQRQQAGLPILAVSMPILLKIDPNLDLGSLQKRLKFEIVSEQEDGFVIVASEDLQLSEFINLARGFSTQVYGSADIASIHELFDDSAQQERLKRILSDTLIQTWPTIADDTIYIVDVGIACTGTVEIPEPPAKVDRSLRESDASWAARLAVYSKEFADWAKAKTEAYVAWDDIKAEREDRVHYFVVESYKGKIHSIIDKMVVEAVKLPDSFTVRIEVNGKGLRDFALNYPFIFEVVEPEDIELPQRVSATTAREQQGIILTAPSSDAPAICIIDSGIQEEHFFLKNAVDFETSHCFLPNASTDVGDYYQPAGHGTRVAGAVLYGETIHRSGSHQLPFWLQNARILDSDCKLPVELFPAAVLRTVVERFHKGPRGTRLFNHSVNTVSPCRTRHMSAWAAEIDELSAQFDILIVQSAGNLYSSGSGISPGIREHFVAGRVYPDYLCEPSSRIANPGQSLQSLTVGSVAYCVYENGGWKSLAPAAAHPSGFSRSGFGIWGVIKPE